jgi:hypothetical protein
VVALFNLSEKEQTVSVPAKGQATELWSDESLRAEGGLSVKLAAHACAVYRVIEDQ